MSMRAGSTATDKEQIAKSFGRSFIELIENFVDNDERLDVVYRCVSVIFDSLSFDDRGLVLKKVLMHFLRSFPTEFEDDKKADEYITKTLQLWKIFGKCSKTMGPVAILDKIADSYVGCWQYYKIYGESLIEEGRIDTDELYKIFKNCMEHCEMSNEEARVVFGPEIMKYVKFPDVSDEDECTINFMQVRQNDIRKSLAARRRSSMVPTKKLEAILEANEKPAPKDDFTVFKDPTVALKQQTASRAETVPVDDFSVFKDPTVALKPVQQRKSFDANANSPTVCGNHLIPNKPILNGDSPMLTSTPDQIRKPLRPLSTDMKP